MSWRVRSKREIDPITLATSASQFTCVAFRLAFRILLSLMLGASGAPSAPLMGIRHLYRALRGASRAVVTALAPGGQVVALLARPHGFELSASDPSHRVTFRDMPTAFRMPPDSYSPPRRGIIFSSSEAAGTVAGLAVVRAGRKDLRPWKAENSSIEQVA